MSSETLLGLTREQLRSLSLENFATVLRKALKKGEEIRWLMGELLLVYAEGRAKRGFARAMAGELGCSTRWVSLLMKVARAFPSHERDAALTWEHHRVAASTSDPGAWLDRAVAKGWSTRQLAEAIREARAGNPGRDEMLAQGDVLVRRVEEYLERWGPQAEQVLRRVRLRLAAWEEAWAKGKARPE